MDEQMSQVKDLGQVNKYSNPKIIVAGVIIVCVIAALVYFKVLPLTPPTSQPKDNSSKSASESSSFQYDTVKAEKLLTDYLKENVKPAYLPEKLEIKQGLSLDNRDQEELKNQFGFISVIQNSTLSANFHYKESSDDPNDYVIFIQPANLESTTPTASLTNSILASYFTNPYTVSDCRTTDAISLCENFQTLNDGKRGYGIVSDDQLFIVFTCFIPLGSKDYETFKSCIRQ